MIEFVGEVVLESDAPVDAELITEGDLGAGELLLEPFREPECERVGCKVMVLMLGIREGIGAVDREMILIPLLVLVAAGMKSVVLLSSAGMAILLG